MTGLARASVTHIGGVSAIVMGQHVDIIVYYAMVLESTHNQAHKARAELIRVMGK